MSGRFEVRLAGTGGQGMILAGIILSEAAAIGAGKNVAQTQSYGPEARGGASKAEIVIADPLSQGLSTGSDAEIDYPKVIQADLLLAMSQEACDRYGREIKPGGWLIVDVDEVKRVPPHPHTLRVPITRIAAEEIGRKITANIVGLGVIVGLTKIVPREAVVQALERRAPPGTVELNIQALEAGLKVSARAVPGSQVSNRVKKQHG
jgi:2-oxoglutarate ferredoxin oxidoreductase subunit gamma